MMHHEFEEIAGYEVSYETYRDVIEPMYMAVNLDKRAFVKLLDKKAFALPTKGEMKKRMRKIANVIWENCGLRTFHAEEEELLKVAREYAERFYGVKDEGDDYVLITRGYAYCGVRQNRGCTFPEEVVILHKGIEIERITLVA